MGPVWQVDIHNGPGVFDDVVTGRAPAIDDVRVVGEHLVRETVVAHELRDLFEGIEFRGVPGQWHQRDVVGDDGVGGVPAGLVEQVYAMRIDVGHE